MPSDFDAKAATWDEDPRKAAVAAAIAQAMVQALPLDRTLTLLDYGAGTGLVSLALAPLVGGVTAADESEGMLSVLRAKIAATGAANVRPLRWSVGQPPAGLPAFDVITGSMVLHHVADVPAAARAFHALLKPGGRIALADLDPDGGEFHGSAMHAHHPGFEREALKAVFEQAGFSSVAFREAHRMTKKTDSGAEREFTIFLMTGERA
ncbi:class I SAM-dependent methyltransferase [Fundidesulfovibrio soli]|uniref:class I SAM-dependent methyltransferase n=1 Tax=Fundidesulfovibrio soli TaxID=2922716 RepID=UPI001FAF295A|nr:class I SAM-dependent methyltransferase [Fundidesulfovibrio soli]